MARLQERLHAGRIAGIRDLAHSFSVLVERAEQLAVRTDGYTGPEVLLDQRMAHLELLVGATEQREGNGSHAG